MFFYAAMQVISVRDPAFFSLKMTCQLKSRRSQDGSRDFVDFRSQPAGYPAITREVWRSQRRFLGGLSATLRVLSVASVRNPVLSFKPCRTKVRRSQRRSQAAVSAGVDAAQGLPIGGPEAST